MANSKHVLQDTETAASHSPSRQQEDEEVMLTVAAVARFKGMLSFKTHIMSHLQTSVIFRFLLGLMTFFLFSI